MNDFLWRRVRADDSGFTLVEALIAMFIATVALSAAGLGTLTMVKGGVAARATQQAANVLNEQIEALRSLDYAATSHVATDATLAVDPMIAGTPQIYAATGEELVVDSVGSVAPHRVYVERNKTQFQVDRYVTRVADAAGAYKRLTVVVTYSMSGAQKSKSFSTFVVDERRGLPLPRFSFSANGTTGPQTAGMGTPVAWGFKLQNLGARDAWNVSASDSNTWTWVLDVDGDGARDAEDTTALPDSDGNGVADTGLVEPGATRYFLAVRTLTYSETTPQLVTFTAVSAAQPPPASEPSPVVTTLNVIAAAGPGGSACATGSACTLTSYFLDQALNGDVATVNPNRLLEGAGSPQAGQPNFSSELLPTAAGRHLASGGVAATTTDIYKVADFRFQVPSGGGSTRSFVGTASVTAWLNCVGTVLPTLSATIGTDSNSSATNVGGLTIRGSGSTAVPTCNGSWMGVTVNVPLSSFSTNGYLVLRLTLQAPSPMSARLLYDSTSAPAKLTMPRT